MKKKCFFFTSWGTLVLWHLYWLMEDALERKKIGFGFLCLVRPTTNKGTNHVDRTSVGVCWQIRFSYCRKEID